MLTLKVLVRIVSSAVSLGFVRSCAITRSPANQSSRPSRGFYALTTIMTYSGPNRMIMRRNSFAPAFRAILSRLNFQRFKLRHRRPSSDKSVVIAKEMVTLAFLRILTRQVGNCLRRECFWIRGFHCGHFILICYVSVSYVQLVFWKLISSIRGYFFAMFLNKINSTDNLWKEYIWKKKPHIHTKYFLRMKELLFIFLLFSFRCKLLHAQAHETDRAVGKPSCP